jgi:hypothetical protein
MSFFIFSKGWPVICTRAFSCVMIMKTVTRRRGIASTPQLSRAAASTASRRRSHEDAITAMRGTDAVAKLLSRYHEDATK